MSSEYFSITLLNNIHDTRRANFNKKEFLVRKKIMNGRCMLGLIFELSNEQNLQQEDKVENASQGINSRTQKSSF